MLLLWLLVVPAAAVSPGLHRHVLPRPVLPLHPVSSLAPFTLSLARIDVSRVHAEAPGSCGVRATASRRRSPVMMGVKWLDQLNSALAARNVGAVGAVGALLLGAYRLLVPALTRIGRFLFQRTDAFAQTAATMGLATKTDMNNLNASIKADMNSLTASIKADMNSLTASIKADMNSLNASMSSRLDEIVALLAPITPVLAELGVRALVDDCAGAKLHVLSCTAVADSTIVRLRLDGIDGGLKLAGERYGLMTYSDGATLNFAMISVVDRSTLKTVCAWHVLEQCADELGAAHAGTVVRAFERVASSSAGDEWELTLVGGT
jgi:hypothetical protein